MRRRALLRSAMVALCGGLTGCLGGSDEADSRSQKCAQSPVTPVSYPDRPESLTNQTVTGYATELERAYQYRRAGNDTVEIHLGRAAASVNRTETGSLVQMEFGLSVYTCTDGVRSVGDGYYSVRYFINETAVYRAQRGGSGDVPDPREHGERIRV
jgi:hypothetical protein